jgi:hypothetical protein
MNYLSVHDWAEHQSYRRDRGQPPWIKVHRCIMRNIKWVALDDAERGQLVAIWLLAADHDGVIPASPDLVQKLCFMSSTPDLSKFIDLGFLDTVGSHSGVNVASTRRQSDVPETETETEESREETEEKKGPKANRFRPPSLSEVTEYCKQRGNSVDPGAFVAYYESNGWRVGRNKMRDWQAAVRTWEQRNATDRKTGNRRNGSHATLSRIAAEDDPPELGSKAVSEVHGGIREALDGEYRRH